LDRFEPRQETGSFRGWLWSITRNKIRDAIRKRSANPVGLGGSTALAKFHEQVDPISLPDHEPSEASQIDQLFTRGLKQVQGEFAPRTWEIFQRNVVDGLATASVAAEFNIQSASVRQIRSRVLRRLRQQFGDVL
jgi:RNA polymerase sigma-70 factor (ECF subfamily)